MMGEGDGRRGGCTDLDLGVVWNSTAARGERGDGDLPDAKVIDVHGMGRPAPVVWADEWGSVGVWGVGLTEFAGEACLFGVGCPFAIDEVVIWTDVEAQGLVAASEGVPASLVEVEEVFPAPEGIVALDDGRDVGFEGGVSGEEGGRIEGGSGHG